ncbi:MAG TPA: 4'-phosphopantetheinyl transferase superfamily protein, partial [Acidiferrobacteraceae bacterium]|nr:4'-phosphopantetheinyl transferase superfamily protein [Acidiferrobacteraceae bacterium]
MLQNQLQQEIHVWFARPNHASNPARLDQYRDILSAQETTRYRRFHFSTDSHHYLIAHALLRHALSKYTDIAPTDWTFSYGKHGRPEISNPNVPALRFNLTHTAGLVGCVVTLDNNCGIDAEAISDRHNPAGVAKRMFSVNECLEMQQLKGAAQLDYFFTRWTLREAYVKARGIGISFPTSKLQFRVDDEARVEVMFETGLHENEHDWCFHLLRPTPEHIAAIAVHTRN